MDTEHTPEPWFVGKDYYGGVSIRTKPTEASNIVGDDAIFENTGRSAGEMSPANARRIVACVNACKGIPLDVLEQWARFLTPPAAPEEVKQ